MDMIWHYYESVRLHVRVMLRQIEPMVLEDFCIII